MPAFTLPVDIPAELKTRLKALGELDDRSVSYLAVKAILEYLSSEEKRLGIESDPLPALEEFDRQHSRKSRLSLEAIPYEPPETRVVAQADSLDSVSSLRGEESLDPSQRAFCNAEDPNIRLLAPAGCGKTLSLLFRCLHLRSSPQSTNDRILVVTFTRAARDEIIMRINEDDRFASLRDHVKITTLNAWGWERVRRIADYPTLVKAGRPYHFTMKNQLQPVWRRHTAVRDAIKSDPHNTPRKLMEIIDSLKSLRFDHEEHTSLERFAERLFELRAQGLERHLADIWDQLTQVGVLKSTLSRQQSEEAGASDRSFYDSFFRFWRDAVQHLMSHAMFTFVDQKYVAFLDERRKLSEGVLRSGAARYAHVFVDEFQDINPLDLALIDTIVKRSKATLTIVGDEDQAIFEWRGATPEYILHPEKYLGLPFETCTLSVNYRSPANIVDLSQRLISHNDNREKKSVRASQVGMAGIEICRTSRIGDALDLVYREIDRAGGTSDELPRIAIIGKKRAQIIPYQIFLASKGVPFCAAEDLQIFLSDAFNRVLELMQIKERRHIRQSSSQLIDDTLALAHLVMRYRIKESERTPLREHLRVRSPGLLTEAVEALGSYEGPLKGQKSNSGGKISRRMAQAIRSFLDASTVSESLEVLGESFDGLKTDLGKAEEDLFFKDPPFFHLAEYAAKYGDDYARFIDDINAAQAQLAHISSFEEMDPDNGVSELWTRPVHLMTALRAKGKEFDIVILLDVNDGIWPHRRNQTKEGLEAERRVFYVAFTRARKRIVLLVSRQIGGKPAVKSPYISELGL